MVVKVMNGRKMMVLLLLLLLLLLFLLLFCCSYYYELSVRSHDQGKKKHFFTT